MAVIDRNQHTVSYYTLELTYGIEGKVSDKKQWMFCGVSSSLSHLNFGLFDGKASEQEFVECIKKELGY